MGVHPKIDRATQPFLRFDRQHGYLSDKRQGDFLSLTGDMGVSVM